MAALKTVKFLTDSDGPSQLVYVNPEYVATVEQDMVKPDQISHVTLATGQYYRVLEPADKAVNRLQGAI